MMDINVNLLQWFYKFFDIKTSATRARSETLATRDKSASTGAIKNGNMSNNKLNNYANQLLENLIKEKYTHLL